MKRKTISILLAVGALLAALTGCDANGQVKYIESENSAPPETSGAEPETEPSVQQKNWKTAFAEQVEAFETEYENTKYALIYLDADVYPELFVESDVENGSVYTYKDDAVRTVCEWGYWRDHAFSRYEPHSGIFYLYSNGGADCYSYEAWQLIGTETVPLEAYTSSVHNLGDGVYEKQFTCNEEIINEEDFESEMNRLKTVSMHPTILSYEEIMELLA